MKSKLLLLFLLLHGIYLYGQQTDTLYFKDRWRQKETSQKKASFYEIHKIANGIEVQTLRKISDQSLISHKEFKEGLPTGVWTDNFFEGRTEILDYNFELVYSDTKIEEGIYPDEELKSNIKRAEYPDGIQAFYQFVGNTMRYPAYARRNGIQGKVLLHIKVTKTGKTEFLSIFEGVNEHLDQEAARVIIQCPNWVPATKNGEPIDSYYITPLTFKMN
ncbi:MAG: energy transducer TonB [Cyclobacteriaceae bacterium]